MKLVFLFLSLLSSVLVVAQTPINTCTTIGTSGTYQVMKPISGDNCLKITGGSVTVSCLAGATIGNVATQISQPPVSITNNAMVTLTGCTVRVTGTSETFIKSPISVIDSAVTLTADTVVGGETYLENSIATIDSGTYETLQVNGGTATFNNSPSFTATPHRGYITHVVLVKSGGVLFAHSGTLTGNWSGTTTEAAAVAAGDGVDDTILLDHVGYGGTVQNLNLTSAFDVGIENVGPLAGWTISDNQFSHFGFACIGGWYASSWDGNTLQKNTCRVSGNAVSSTPRLFHWAYYQWGGAFDPIIYFRNNNVTENIWIPDATVTSGYALWLDPTFATAYGSALVVSSNTFARNSFSAAAVPISAHMIPPSGIIDGGSNLGSSISWPDQPAPYPLQFGSSALPVGSSTVVTPPSVTVTSPAGVAVSGTISFSASATAGAGLRMSNLQLKVDGSNFGAAATVSGATLTVSLPLNTVSLSNGAHSLAAVGVDSNGNTTVSLAVAITVNNVNSVTSLPAPLAFISGQTPGTVRNNFTGLVGMQFTIGRSAITVTQLGRMCVPGNAQAHTLKLVKAPNSSDLGGGATIVTMAGCTPGQFQYAILASPVSLLANTSYYIVSQEFIGGDQWYDYGPVTAVSGAGIVNGPVYLAGSYVLVPSPAYSYVPLNFKYTNSSSVPAPSVSVVSPVAGPVSGTVTVMANAVAAAGLTMNKVQFQLNGATLGSTLTGVGPTYSISLDTTTLTNGSSYSLTAVATDSSSLVTTSLPVVITVNNASTSAPPSFITGQTFGSARNNYSGFVGMQFTTAPTPVTVNSLGRMCAAGNFGVHLLKLVTADGTNVTGGSVNITMSGCVAGLYRYAALDIPVTLTPSTAYYLVSQEALQGDAWYDYAPITSTPSVGTVNGPAYFNGSYYVVVPSPASSYVPVTFQYGVLPSSSLSSISITAPVAGQVSRTINITASAVAASGLTIKSVQLTLNGIHFGSPLSGSGPSYSTQLDTTTLVNGATYTLTMVATDSAGNTLTSAPVAVQVNNSLTAASPLINAQTLTTIRNNFSGFVGMKFTTAKSLTVSALGRFCSPGNSAAHLMKLVNGDGTDLPGGSATVMMSGCTPGQYQYGTLASSVRLTANTAVYLVSLELLGGDSWWDYAPVAPVAGAATVNGPVYFAGGYQLVPSPGYSYVPLNILYQ